MKHYALFALFVFLVSFSTAIPIPGGDGDKLLDKGKGRAVDTPPPSRPPTPRPEDDPTVPLPGRTGIHTDPNTNVVTLHYGDDHLHEHMGHLQRNQADFPHNRNPMSLATDDRNRDNALHNIPTAGPHPVTGENRVRDEKMLNMLNNPHHATSTSVEYLPESESHKEGGHTSAFKAAIEKAGPNAQGQLRPNPGWLTLHPDQRRGHEAPARLGTQNLRPGYKVGSIIDSDGKKRAKIVPSDDASAINGKKQSKSEGKKAQRSTSTAEYTPVIKNTDGSEKSLRTRKGKEAPPPPAPPREKKPKDGPSNLRPGRVSPPGHVWHPSTDGPSHANAPGHLPNAEQRFPPRPQNHEHYMKQLSEKKATDDKQKQATSQHHAPAANAEKYLPKKTANLAAFEAKFGPAKKGNGSGRAQEAPARMQTHTTHSNPPSRPPSPHSPPSTRPPSPAHASTSKQQAPKKTK